MDETTRTFLFDVRPFHRETTASYTRRLLEANFETPNLKDYLLKLRPEAKTTAANDSDWVSILATKTGRPQLRLEADLHGWLTHADGTACTFCSDLLPNRWACTLCAHGEVVEQHPHFDNIVCIRHSRWVGLTTPPDRQHPVGKEQRQAAMTLAKLRRQHRIDVRLYLLAINAVIGKCAPTPIAQSAAFPIAIRLIERLTNNQTTRALFDPRFTFQQAYKKLGDIVREITGATNTHIVRAFWLHMRPAAAALRRSLLSGEPFAPYWEHDFPLSCHVANGFPPVDMDELEAFTNYLNPSGDSPTSALDYGLTRNGLPQPNRVSLETRFSEAGEHLIVCARGHQYSVSTSRNGAPVKKPCPVCAEAHVRTSNYLSTKFPAIAAQLDRERNDSACLVDIRPGSHRKLYWLCEKQHSYLASPANRTIGKSGCPICQNRQIVRGINDIATTHPALVAEWHPSYLLQCPPTKVGAANKTRLPWLCVNGHEFWAPIFERAQGRGCPECRKQPSSLGVDDLTITHPQLAAEWSEKNGTRKPSDFTYGSKETAIWTCPAGHSYTMRIERRASGYNCKLCSSRKLVSGINDLATTQPILVREYHPTLNSKPASEIFGSNTKLWWRCIAAEHLYAQTVPHRIESHGCPECPPELRLLNKHSSPLKHVRSVVENGTE